MDKQWKMVPVEPTPEMIAAAYAGGHGAGPGADYAAMLAAAPQPPSASDERERMIAFLMGESEIDGVAFGERHPTERGAFWWRNRLRTALAPSPGVDAVEPVGSVVTMEALGSRDGVKYHAQLYRPLPSGTKLYAAPVAAPSPAASADEWMAEAEWLVEAHSREVANATAYGHAGMGDARAALLAHLKARP